MPIDPPGVGSPWTETVDRNGSWVETSKESPHLHFPELSLQMPNMDLFTKKCHYQPFMYAYRTDGMSDAAIKAQSEKKWSPKSKENVVLRTAVFGHNMHNGLQLCAKREDYSVGKNAKKEGTIKKGLGEDVVVPLAVLQAMRKEMGKKLRQKCHWPLGL